jgi:N-acetyl-anhydromuramoyl-L-alanine amidase
MKSSTPRNEAKTVLERPCRTAEPLVIDEFGWLGNVERIASPNFDERPEDVPIELLVIHGISLPPGEFGGPEVALLFTNALQFDAHPYFAQLTGLRVSAHFFVRRDGQLIQFVSCLKRAWHAGASCWRGRERCNDFSIGIEFEGVDSLPYEGVQYSVCVNLIRVLQATYPIQGVAGHSELAPGRKTDPGPAFDWSRLGLVRPRC